jgi:hypothetical protein
MNKYINIIVLITTDFIAVTASFIIWAWLRSEMGLFSETSFVNIFYLALIIFFYWFLLFAFFGLYSTWRAKSHSTLTAIFRRHRRSAACSS